MEVAIKSANPIFVSMLAPTRDTWLFPASVTTGNTSGIAIRPYRPRARVLPAPIGVTPLERLRALTDASAAPQPGETIEASPADSAMRILEVLTDWGYIP